MRHDWLLDVLSDLRGFARDEGFERLAEQIDEALATASAEIARGEGAVAHRPPDLFGPQQGNRRH